MLLLPLLRKCAVQQAAIRVKNIWLDVIVIVCSLKICTFDSYIYGKEELTNFALASVRERERNIYVCGIENRQI